MFRSRPMRKVELVIPERDVVAVTELLATLRCFHLIEPSGVAGGPSTTWLERANAYGMLAQRILDLMTLLGVEVGRAPKEPLHLISPDVASRDIDTLEQEARAPVTQLREAQKRLSRLQQARRQVKALLGLNLSLEELRETRYLNVFLGSIPSDNVERLQMSLERIPSVLEVLGQDDRTATVALFGLKRDTDILLRAARSAFLNLFDFPPEAFGKPEDALEGLDASILRTKEQIKDLQATIQRIHETRIRRLHHLLWRVKASQAIVQAIAHYERFRYTYLATGWVPAGKVEVLRRRLAELSPETVLEVRRPTSAERHEAPFEFDNPPFLKLFERLVAIYGYPNYNELDPTPFVALTFPLLFGAMFGDAGHGLFLVALGVLLSSGKLKALRTFKSWGGIVIACGVVATFFGFLYGSVFGYEDVLPALWLQPLKDTTTILMTSVGFGALVLSVGMILHMVDAGIQHAWGRLILDGNGLVGLLFYWALLGLAVGAFNVQIPFSREVLLSTVGLGAVLLFLREWLLSLTHANSSVEEQGLGMTLVEGGFELFEIILSLISNTLSYVRVGAFAVAHGALSLVVFLLAEMLDVQHGAVYWIVVALGNVAVIGFEGMIVGIQTLRLEYYEFFSRFFQGSGERYRPLSLVESKQA